MDTLTQPRQANPLPAHLISPAEGSPDRETTKAIPLPPVRKNIMEIISQCGIFVGAMAVVALGSGSRWGFVLGLSVQPFWYYTSIRHRQWGIVAAGALYGCGWVLGVYRNFF